MVLSLRDKGGGLKWVGCLHGLREKGGLKMKVATRTVEDTPLGRSHEQGIGMVHNSDFGGRHCEITSRCGAFLYNISVCLCLSLGFLFPPFSFFFIRLGLPGLGSLYCVEGPDPGYMYKSSAEGVEVWDPRWSPTH